MAKQIQMYKLGVVLDVDGARGLATLKATDKELKSVDHDARKAEGAVKGFGGSLNRLSGGLKSLFGSGGGSIIPGLSHVSNIIQGLPQIGQLAGALIGPFKELAEQGLQFNMLIEDAQLGFEGVVGGVQEAKRYVKELTDFAARNPIFNTQGTVTAARQMAVFGFETRKTTEYLKTWGNVLAAGGKFNDENLQGIVTAFGQMRTKGKVSAEEMNQLLERGVPGWEMLAKAIGKTTAETMKLAEQGRLKGPEAVDAITAMLAAEPRFAGAADRYARGLSGRLAQVQDLREVAAGQVMSGTAKEMTSVLEAAMTGSVPDIVNRMATGMDAALTPVAKVIGMSVRGVIGGGITSGLAEGIDLGRSLVTRTVSDFALDSVISPFKRMLGINSPSTVFAEYGDNVAQGFEDGLVDRTSRGFDRWAEALEKAGGDAFVKGVERIAKRLGVDPAYIMNMLAAESRFNPRARNPLPGQSAAGLFQATNQTARGLGFKNSEQLRLSSIEKQLDALARYLTQRGVRPGATQEQVYGAVGYGTAIDDPNRVIFRRGSERYRLNKVWDVNRDGVIRYGELGEHARRVGGFSSAAGFTVNNAPVSASNPVPVYGVGGNASLSLGGRGVASDGGYADRRDAYMRRFEEAERQETARVLARTREAAETLPLFKNNLEGVISLMPPISAEATRLAYALPTFTVETKRAEVAAGSFAKSVIGSANKMDSVMSAFGQVAGMMPGGGQATGKRGFFSKMLGFAAPFLNFIPGVGPILSTLAGMGSAALAGDWGGVTTGAVSGFSTGGAFRPSGVGGSSALPTVNHSGVNGISLMPAGGSLPGRAGGGPVQRGRAYVIGEYQTEVFEPDQDGWVHPSLDAYRRSRGGLPGGGGDGGWQALVGRLTAQLERMESRSAGEWLRMGSQQDAGAITDGLMRHGSQDPRVVEWMQRQVLQPN